MKADTLHGAAKLGDAEAAETLLQEGTEVNEKDARGITALGVAVGFNKLPVIEVLLRAGADVTLTDAKGNTPLHYAAGTPRIRIPLFPEEQWKAYIRKRQTALASTLSMGRKSNTSLQNAAGALKTSSYDGMPFELSKGIKV